jgi:hypothetical protein
MGLCAGKLSQIITGTKFKDGIKVNKMDKKPPEWKAQVPLSTTTPTMSVLEEFLDVMTKTKLDGNTVVDTARLPHPKDSIIAAIILNLKSHKDDANQTSLRTAGHSLAFFQAGVGDDGPTLDDKAPDGQIWRDIVQADMKSIALSLAL